MPDTDLKLVMQELKTMNTTLNEHGQELKNLTKVMTSIALQKQRMETLEARVTEAWVKLNLMKDYQSKCPRDQLATIKWALGGIWVGFITYIAAAHK